MIDSFYPRFPSNARKKKINKQQSIQSEIEIISLGGRGDGVGKLSGKNVFVPFSSTGDKLLISMIGERGKIVEIIKPSLDRTVPFCPHFTICGGCVLQHLNSDTYQSWKKNIVRTALCNQGLDVQIDDLIDAHGNGRRRVTLHVLFNKRKTQVGFMQGRSNELFDLDKCPVLTNSLSEVTIIARSLSTPLISFSRRLKIVITAFDCGLDCDIQIPMNLNNIDADIRTDLAKIATKLDLARVAVSGDIIVERRPPFIKLGQAKVFPPPSCFLQATLAGEKAIGDLVFNYACGAYKVADLFCGIGFFALRLAVKSHVLAVDCDESHISALSKAVRNCQGLKPVIPEVRDLVSNPYMANELSNFDCVIFNPPRSGAKAQAKEISNSGVPIVIAVSCDPASFARDSSILTDGCYFLEQVTPIDQFKFTRHVEMVAVFMKRESK